MKRLLPLIFALVSASILLSWPVVAQTASPRTEEEDWAQKPRLLNFVPGTAGFHYDSSRPVDAEGPRPPGAVEDRITASYRVPEADLQLTFASYEPGNETSLDARLTFASLTEFVDGDQDGRYDAGDEVVQRIALPGNTTATFRVDEAVTDGHRATVQYKMESPGGGGLPIGGSPPSIGTFEIAFVVAPTTKTVDGVLVPPTQIHMEFQLERFPYKANASRVALETKISSSREFQSQPDRLAFGAGVFEGNYEWGLNGVVPARLGVTVVSNPRGIPGGFQQTVLFAFERATTIEHDASLGVVRYQTASLPDVIQQILDGDWRLYSIGILLSAAVVGGSAFVRLRRKA